MPDCPRGLAHGLRALRHDSYRRFWIGALVSNSGTWLQNLTVPYVLLEITDAASWAGLAAFASIFPVMVLGPIAGNLADRFDRRTSRRWSNRRTYRRPSASKVSSSTSPGPSALLPVGRSSPRSDRGGRSGSNAASFGAVLLALALVDPRTTRQQRNPQPIIKGSSARSATFAVSLVSGVGIALAACVAFLGFPVVSFVVVYAKQVYGVDPLALGLLSV